MKLTCFAVLHGCMVGVVIILLNFCVGPMQVMVSKHAKTEPAYISASHFDFIGGSCAVTCWIEQVTPFSEIEQQRQVGVSTDCDVSIALGIGIAVSLSKTCNSIKNLSDCNETFHTTRKQI